MEDVFINKFESSASTPKPTRKGPPLVRIIFIIFALIITFELVMGLKTLLTPVKLIAKPQVVTKVISDGSIIVTSSKPIYKVGEVVPVTIKISTGGHLTAGVDLVLKYDPAKLEASSASFIKGDLYDDYPPVNLDSTGLLRISGVVSTEKKGFNGEGVFGTINFTAREIGVSDISLDFVQSQTNDSNILEVGTNNDVLGNVESVSITIE